MTGHPTAPDLDRYLAGALDAEAAARLEQHVVSCIACRTMVDDRALLAVGAIGREIETEAGEHLEFEELASYVDGAVDRGRRKAIDMHLSTCEACEADRAALAEERSHLPVGAAPGTMRGPWVRAAAAVIAAVGLGGWWAMRDAAPVDSAIPSPAIATPTASLLEGAPRLSLLDRGRTVRVQRDGRLTGVPAAADADVAIVVETVVSGRLPSPGTLGELAGRPDPLMGRAPGSASQPLSPAGVVVESDRPEFSWPATAGARAYVVAVLDDALRIVVESPRLSTRVWTPAAPLGRGVTYQWQVTADTPAGPVVAPAPPAPVARFRVLDAGLAASLQTARRADSRLVLGILLARAGLLEDAQRELSALAEENPESAIVASLVAQARGARP